MCGVGYAQAFQYYNNFPRDTMIRKSLVAASVLLSLVGLVGAYADVYVVRFSPSSFYLHPHYFYFYVTANRDLLGSATFLLLHVR